MDIDMPSVAFFAGGCFAGRKGKRNLSFLVDYFQESFVSAEIEPAYVCFDQPFVTNSIMG
jgi:hypothetical protein